MRTCLFRHLPAAEVQRLMDVSSLTCENESGDSGDEG